MTVVQNSNDGGSKMVTKFKCNKNSNAMTVEKFQCKERANIDGGDGKIPMGW
jgi:hypothetical protein